MDVLELKKDRYLKEIAKRYSLSDDQIKENYHLIQRVCLSRNRCDGCKGLFMCQQLSKGQRLSLNMDPVLFEEIEYCDYALKERRKKDLKDAYVYCDIPHHLMDIDLENVSYTPEQKQLYLKLAAILHKKTEKGLYISGDLGAGKTYLCIALANSLVKNHEKTAFVKVADFFNDMKAYVSSSSQLVDQNIRALKNVTYLILDDIGPESVSEFVRDDVLFPILDDRMENKRMTIFTSNLNKEELLKHYQYDRKDKSNLMNAKRLMERIDILSDDYVLSGINMRRK